jgi:large subunit ribosomal protein L49
LSGSQSTPTTILARRCFATTPSTRSEPPSTTTTTAPSSATTSTESPTADLAKRPSTKQNSRKFFKLRKEQRTQQTQQEQPAEQAAEQLTQEASEQPPAEQAPAQQQPAEFSYRVLRTPSNQLAVYQLAKRGGNKKITNIKKVEGDRASFRAGLAQLLGIEEKAVLVNNLTGHVVVPVSGLSPLPVLTMGEEGAG